MVLRKESYPRITKAEKPPAFTQEDIHKSMLVRQGIFGKRDEKRAAIHELLILGYTPEELNKMIGMHRQERGIAINPTTKGREIHTIIAEEYAKIPKE